MTFSSLVTLIFGLTATPQAYGYTFFSSSAFSSNCEIAAISSNTESTIVNSFANDFSNDILAQNNPYLAPCQRDCERAAAERQRLSQQYPGSFFYDPMDLLICKNNCDISKPTIQTYPSPTNRNPNPQACLDACVARCPNAQIGSIVSRNMCTNSCVNRCY